MQSSLYADQFVAEACTKDSFARTRFAHSPKRPTNMRLLRLLTTSLLFLALLCSTASAERRLRDRTDPDDDDGSTPAPTSARTPTPTPTPARTPTPTSTADNVACDFLHCRPRSLGATTADCQLWCNNDSDSNSAANCARQCKCPSAAVVDGGLYCDGVCLVTLYCARNRSPRCNVYGALQCQQQ